jgi:predicted PurR-regulated permease PerM
MPAAPAAEAEAIEAQAVEKQTIGSQIVGTQIVETQANVSDARQDLALPQDVKTLLLLGIFSLLFLYALYLLGEVVIPIIVAFMLNMALQPPFQFITRHHVPKVAAALLIVILGFGFLCGIAYVLSAPTAAWLDKAPESMTRLQTRLAEVIKVTDRIQKAGQQVEKMSADKTAPVVAVKGPPLSNFLYSGTRALVTGLLTTAVLLFFLLVSGDIFLRRLIEILPTMSDKKQAVTISNEIQDTVSGYLGTITLMNAVVGLLTGIAAHFCGLSDPLMWGSIAFVLNFAPIIGPLICLTVFLLAGLLSFDSLWQAFLPAGLYLIIHLVEGESVTPMLLARRFTLNPVLVIMSLVFWYWMWGVAGAILAVPMLATFKLVCDHIEPLMALGHFLGSEARAP